MPAMIQPCPVCGRNGIMSKANGLCFHCNKGSKPKIVKTTAELSEVMQEAKRDGHPQRSKPAVARTVRGRVAR